MKGRKPTPTSLKILADNPGHRPINKNEPSGVVSIPEPPAHLSDTEKEVWNRFGETLKNAGILTNLDAMAFEVLVRAYVAATDAARKVAEFGPVWVEKGEGKIPKFAYSPYWAVQNREEKKLVALLAEFGLTPSSRTRVKVEDSIKSNNGKSRFFNA